MRQLPDRKLLPVDGAARSSDGTMPVDNKSLFLFCAAVHTVVEHSDNSSALGCDDSLASPCSRPQGVCVPCSHTILSRLLSLFLLLCCAMLLTRTHHSAFCAEVSN
ncbi:unnamed protein product, partial [Ectocarpus sp. 8 AP-2014]